MNFTLDANGMVPEYPKIQTLWLRDLDAPGKIKPVIPGFLSRDEFAQIKYWAITEKIDGTNTRIAILPDGTVFYGGRTNSAQIPSHLLNHLINCYPLDVLRKGIHPVDAVVTIYGEGYGPMIQSGGWYSQTVDFRVFDIRIGDWWLDKLQVEDICNDIGMKMVPVLHPGIEFDVYARDPVALGILEDWVYLPSQAQKRNHDFPSQFVSRPHEGIVAFTNPGLFNRKGERIMWKLKTRDFQGMEGKE